MSRRALHVLGALAVVMAVAVLARPSPPDVPPPFTVERETPEPDANPPPTPDPAPSPEPTEELPSGTVLTLHFLDEHNVQPVRPPASIHVPVVGARAELSPDGRWLAVAVPQPHPGAGTLLRLHEVGRLREQHLDPAVEIAVPAFADWFGFAPDGDGVVWLENHERAGLRAGGATVDGDRVSRLQAVSLPPNLWLYGIAALRDGRVGVVASQETGRSPAGWGLAPPRLLVADLHAGALDVDLQLPLPDAMVVADEAGRVELVPGIAWDVPRDRVYVARADRDAVLLADLVGGTLAAEQDVLGPRTDEVATTTRILLARALAQPDDTLYQGTWREAVLSEDGAVLYVHGSYLGAPEPPAEGQPEPPRQRLLPLLAVDAGTLAAFGVDEPPRARVLAVSPEAEHVFVAQGFLPRGTPSLLRMLDGRTLEERWNVSTGGEPPGLVRFSGDGQRVVVAAEERSGAGDRTSVVLHAAATGEVLGHAGFPGAALDVDLTAALLLTRNWE